MLSLLSFASTAETKFKLGASGGSDVFNITIPVKMDIWDESSTLKFDIYIPEKKHAIIDFEFSDQILSLLNKFDSERLEISITDIKEVRLNKDEGSHGRFMDVSISFDASAFLSDHLDRVIESNETLDWAKIPKECFEPYVVSSWSPLESDVKQGFSFSQNSKVSCNINGTITEVDLLRYSIGTKV